MLRSNAVGVGWKSCALLESISFSMQLLRLLVPCTNTFVLNWLAAKWFDLSRSPGGTVTKRMAGVHTPLRLSSRIHFSGPSGFPLVSRGCQGRFQKFWEFVRDRTQTRRKLKVQGGLFGKQKQNFSLRPRSPLRNSRSWRVLAAANRRDWSVRNSKCFCRVFHLSRNDRIAKGIGARNDF